MFPMISESASACLWLFWCLLLSECKSYYLLWLQPNILGQVQELSSFGKMSKSFRHILVNDEISERSPCYQQNYKFQKKRILCNNGQVVHHREAQMNGYVGFQQCTAHEYLIVYIY